MPDEGFLRRWSRRKTESRQGQELPDEPLPPLAQQDAPQEPVAAAPAPASAPADAREADAALPLPTMDDVASLTHDSDFSAFVARGVDMAVRRSALKKLFADPHFNTMDGLDIYIDDYTRPSPLSEPMLASLRHAARLFERVAGDAAEPASPAAAQEEAIAAAIPADPAEAPSGDDLQHQQHPPETETR